MPKLPTLVRQSGDDAAGEWVAQATIAVTVFGMGLITAAAGALQCGTSPMLSTSVVGMICSGIVQGLLVTP